MEEPYRYVRFTWDPVDPNKIAENLKNETFHVEIRDTPTSEKDLVLQKDDRLQVFVKADNLNAYISSLRAVLFQKRSLPFTEKDLKLRNLILDIYPKSRSSTLPWPLLIKEPKFEIVK